MHTHYLSMSIGMAARTLHSGARTVCRLIPYQWRYSARSGAAIHTLFTTQTPPKRVPVFREGIHLCTEHHQLNNLHIRHYSPKAVNVDLSLTNKTIQKYLQTQLEEYDAAHKELLSMEDNSEENLNRLSKIMLRLRPTVDLYKDFLEKQKAVNESQELIDSMSSQGDLPQSEDDVELLELARVELQEMKAAKRVVETQILTMLVPRERADHNDIIMEVTAGVGGQEAMLFTSEIFDMYDNYSVFKNWAFQVLSYDEPDKGGVSGLRKASASISGQDVYKYLKYEGGVHRVQRVPKTEKTGRVHTSTMTVAVLPQPTEIDIQILDKDLKITAVRASGAGGQHVNTTDSAVRIVHIPSGIAVECQAGRSQFKNKDIAIRVLRSKLYERELDQQTQDIQNRRKLQVGTRARSEKIRTYNFNQDRITDHRLSECSFNIGLFMKGGAELDETIQELQEESANEALINVIEDLESSRS